MKDELKRCPFCGGEAALSHGYVDCGHDHYEDDGIACDPLPVCAAFCRSAVCPAHRMFLGCGESIFHDVIASPFWGDSARAAIAAWNRRTNGEEWRPVSERAAELRDGMIDAARQLADRDCGAMQSEMREAQIAYLAKALRPLPPPPEEQP